jgi:DNA repair protein RAD50
VCSTAGNYSEVTALFPLQKAEAEEAENVLRSRNLETEIERRRTEEFSLQQRVKALQKDRDQLAAVSTDRLKLELRKEALHEREAQLTNL